MRLLRLIAKGVRISIWRLRHYGLAVTFTWAWTRLYLWTLGRPVWRYCSITPQLYVGGQISAAGWRWLKSRGLTDDVNMRTEFDDVAAGITPQGYLWLPTEDDDAPTQRQLHTGVDFIREAVKRGGVVYVHCASGVGRAPTMAAAYLVSTGMRPEESLELIRRVRPFIKPTPPQIAALEEFAAGYVDAEESDQETHTSL